MTEISDSAEISSDLPRIDPRDDVFGFTPFSKRVAAAISATAAPRGLVMAVNGPWGAGKTTLLNFVKHQVALQPEAARPIVIDFNPWWFSGHEDLAPQVIEAFRKALPTAGDKFKKLGDSLADYSDVIGTAATVATGHAWAKPIVGRVLKFFKRKTRSVPDLKKDISKRLLESGQRFLFVIDDIDRLAPVEICALIRVIKALGDFILLMPTVFRRHWHQLRSWSLYWTAPSGISYGRPLRDALEEGFGSTGYLKLSLR